MPFISFKVGMDPQLMTKALSLATWPAGLVVRAFVKRPRGTLWEPKSSQEDQQDGKQPAVPPSSHWYCWTQLVLLSQPLKRRQTQRCRFSRQHHMPAIQKQRNCCPNGSIVAHTVHHVHASIASAPSHSKLSTAATFNASHPLDSRTSGRTVKGIQGTPTRSYAVAQFAASAHHSRPDPAVGSRVGVFRPSNEGKYPRVESLSLPEVPLIYSFAQSTTSTAINVAHPSAASSLTPSNAAASNVMHLSAASRRIGTSGRTVKRTQEAPTRSHAVAQSAASAHHSRPDPAVGGRVGVFRPSTEGKYSRSESSAPPEVPSAYSFAQSTASAAVNSAHPSAAPSFTTSIAATSNAPHRSEPRTSGRTVEGTQEAPTRSHAVAQSAASAHHSRPDPAVGGRVGVFRPCNEGEYLCSPSSPLPDTPSASSSPAIYPAIDTPRSGAANIDPRVDNLAAGITVYYQNVRGLRMKTADLQIALGACDYDVVALTETWLHENIANAELSDAYNIYRGDRTPATSTLQRGGGALIAIKKGINCEVVHLNGSDRLEQITVKIKLSRKTLFVCCVYIRPNSDPTLYVEHCSCVQNLCELAGSNAIVVVLGDYNLPNLQWAFDTDLNSYIPTNASAEQELIMAEAMLESGLHQVFNLPNPNGRLLDLAFINEPEHFELLEPPLPVLRPDAHHRPFILKCNLYVPLSDSCGRFCYDFNQCNVAAANARVAAIDWLTLLANCSIDEAVSRLYEALYSIIDDTVPMKWQAPLTNPKQDWWNRELRNLRNRLRRARNRFFHARPGRDRQRRQAQLVAIELEYNTKNNIAFQEYIHQIEAQVKSDPTTFWKFVKKRKRSNATPINVTYGNVRSESALDSANLFAAYFSSVHRDSPPAAVNEFLDHIPAYELYLPSFEMSREDVSEAFAKIDPGKGPGPDGIAPLFIQKCASTLSQPLSLLYNTSLRNRAFPAEWKLASVTPIFKAGNVHQVENYRPISILNSFAKVFEKMVHNVIYSAVRPIISEFQHGFVKKRSTTSNLMSFVSYVINKIEKSQQVDAIYVDFAKAFDRVPHGVAIEKMRRYGLPEWILAWLNSYLTDRFAYVKVGNAHSTSYRIASGVPQGSVLGPLIFILFINDLCDHISAEKLLFADDLKFYRPVVSPLDCCAMQRDLDVLQRWCMANGMESNASKCKVISFSRSRSPFLHSYTMVQTDLPRTDAIKDLGVLIDSKARFNQHIATVTAKAFATLGFLRRNTADFTDLFSLKALFCSLIRSQLEYAVQVWAPYHVQQISRIERVQRAFLRYACRRVDWRHLPHEPGYADRSALLNLDSLDSRRKFMRRMLVFDVLHGHIDCSDLLRNVHLNVPSRRLRESSFLRIPRHHTSYGYNAPLSVCCRLFNDVQDEFDFNVSKHRFKIRIRNR